VKPVYNIFYHLLPVKKINTDNQLFLLNEAEINAIDKKEKIAVRLAAITGALGVVILYVQQYNFPHWFPDITFSIFGKSITLSVIMLLYSVVLVIIEIILLTLLNIWCVHEVVAATGFLTYNNKKLSNKRNLLLDIGLEKKNKRILTYDIDPLQDVNKKALLAWNFFFILKANLSNMLFKVLIQRLPGRYAVKAVQGFAGIHVFAAWNAYGTKVILKEARVIIMGQHLIEMLVATIRKDQDSAPYFKELLYDTLQYIAISKRDFHQNHFILTEKLFELYAIAPKAVHWLKDGYYKKLHAAGK
jgi:hypothetical protein